MEVTNENDEVEKGQKDTLKIKNSGYLHRYKQKK